MWIDRLVVGMVGEQRGRHRRRCVLSENVVHRSYDAKCMPRNR